MGVFGKKPVSSVQPSPAARAKAPAEKAKVVPVKLLKVKLNGDQKTTYLTGLFLDRSQPKGAQKLSGKDKEGNKFVVFINEGGNANLSYIPAGEKDPVKLTGLFFNAEGKFGPYHSGKTEKGDRFYMTDYVPREEA